MKFQLYKIIESKRVLVSDSDAVELLEFSKLQCCAEWEIWVSCNDYNIYQAAHVNWLPCAKYKVLNNFDGAETLIKQHSLIIPMVRGIIFYNWMFGSYEKIQYAKSCRVLPVCEA